MPNHMVYFEVFHDATFLKDSNIINIPLEQIGNKASSPIGGYCDQAFERVSVFVWWKSIPLSGKIPGTLHSELSAINNAPYFSHGLEHFGEEFA